MHRSRPAYLLLILTIILLGLASRKFSTYLPDFLAAYAGDALWALLIFWLVGFLFVSKSSSWVAGVAISFCFLIEVSQLYRVPWLDAVRATTIGSLVLGRGFLWSDLLCYAAGILVGYLLEISWRPARVKVN